MKRLKLRELRNAINSKGYTVKDSVKANARSIEAYLTNTFGFVTIKNIQEHVLLEGNNAHHEFETALIHLLVKRMITRINLGNQGWVYGTD